jgi:hypothetical protein
MNVINSVEKQSLNSLRNNIFGGNIFKFISDKLSEIGVVSHEKIVPLYLSSVGAHILNFLNVGCARLDEEGKPDYSICPFFGSEKCPRATLPVLRTGADVNFYKIFSQVPDLRVHVMHVAPSGFGKDFFMNIFMDPNHGILPEIVPHTMVRGFLSEAGYIGTINRDKKGNVSYTYGLAYKYCTGIIGMPEFTNVTLTSQQQHSLQLENDMLEILSGGKINKTMANGVIEYNSYHTLWAGTQPTGGRFNVSTGLGRRFVFFLFLPTKEEQKAFFNAQKNGKYTNFNALELNSLRAYISKLWQVRLVDRIVFTPEYEKFRDSLPMVNHTNIQLFDNIALGYNFVKSFDPLNPVITVELDEILKSVLFKVAQDRTNIMREAYIEWQLLLPMIFNSDVPLRYFDVVREIEKTQMLSYKDAVEKLNLAIKEGVIGTVQYTKKGVTNVYVYNIEKFANKDEAVSKIR